MKYHIWWYTIEIVTPISRPKLHAMELDLTSKTTNFGYFKCNVATVFRNIVLVTA